MFVDEKSFVEAYKYFQKTKFSSEKIPPEMYIESNSLDAVKAFWGGGLGPRILAYHPFVLFLDTHKSVRECGGLKS